MLLRTIALATVGLLFATLTASPGNANALYVQEAAPAARPVPSARPAAILMRP